MIDKMRGRLLRRCDGMLFTVGFRSELGVGCEE